MANTALLSLLFLTFLAFASAGAFFRSDDKYALAPADELSADEQRGKMLDFVPAPTKNTKISTISRRMSTPRRSMAEGGPAAAPTSTPTRAPGPQPSKPASKSRSKSHKVRRWILGVAIGALVGSVLGIFVGGIGRVMVILWKRRRNADGPMIFHARIQPKMLDFLNSPEAFGSLIEIGKGGSGTVYRGMIQALELPIAVKRIVKNKVDQETKAGENNVRKSNSRSSGLGSVGRQLSRAEIETLGKVRHMNLTALYAYIQQPAAHLLVYQFMPKGSVSDALKTTVLDWPTRRRIAIGMASGLKYLHHDCTPKILHRDLKTANILLDEDNEAHLGDFGLAKALPNDMTHITTGVSGTVGYMAPEYRETCKFTTSSDVYSMGIVLGVLLCGREPYDEFFSDIPGGLSGWITYLVQTGQELKGIDPNLVPGNPEQQENTTEDAAGNREGGEGAGNWEGGEGGPPVMASVNDIEEMKLAMRIVCHCTRLQPKERPSSKDVLVMLNPNRLVTARPMSELITEDC